MKDYLGDKGLPGKDISSVGKAPKHESAHMHVTGEAVYIDDMPLFGGTLHAAPVLSGRAHAKIRRLDLSETLSSPGVMDILTAKDIPGSNGCGPIVDDEPILADGTVDFIGQPVLFVIAKSYLQARVGASLAKVEYDGLEAVLNPSDARDKGLEVIPEMNLERGKCEAALKKSPYQIEGTFEVGGQDHFYLEGQISYALPGEDFGMTVYSSTQHPSEMQHVVARALSVPSNKVRLEVRRLGGGFGGKESQSALFAAAAALCARKTGMPVKLRLDRDDDMLSTGKRHSFRYEYEVGFDGDGRILAYKMDMTVNAGFSADLTGPVATRAICHVDNAYFLPDVNLLAFCAKTNTQSNTAFRGFGGPQGSLVTEHVMEAIATELSLDALTIRKRNFYHETRGLITPYGQTVEDNVIHELVAELEKTGNYEIRKKEIAEFNRNNALIKKGLSLTPVKFGISFNVKHFNQAGALVHVYTDGSVLVNHGGTEMGQGLHTKVSQVVAAVFGLPLSHITATATDTSKVANTSATAASTGTDLNGKAAENAALKIRGRISESFAGKHGGSAGEVRFENGNVILGGITESFAQAVCGAYENSVQLWSDGFYTTPGLSWNRDNLRGTPFYYFAYGAAISEVAVDVLTGEWQLLETDILHDAGNSINPAIDIGQIEGGYIQGMGWLTNEELWWNDSGKLMTHAPSTYKIPAVNDCPTNFQTRLFHNPNRKDTVMRSKAVGEPPLLLGFSVFFAIRDAVASVGDYRINPKLNAPATPEAIFNAIRSIEGTDK